MLLQGKKIFITGGCSGIGKAAVRKCLAEGAHVTVMDFASDEKLAALKAEMGSKCYVIRADGTKAEEVYAAVDYAVEKMGGLTGAVNCVGGSKPGMILDLDEKDFDACIRFCLNSMFYSIRAEAKYMLEDGGSIVNISSINAASPSEGAAAYNCGKAAVDALTKTAALEFGCKKIRVNAIRPGCVNTEAVQPLTKIQAYADIIKTWTPLEMFGRPEDIGNTAAFLLSDECIYMSGTIINIDGGIDVYGNPNTVASRTVNFAEVYG